MFLVPTARGAADISVDPGTTSLRLVDRAGALHAAPALVARLRSAPEQVVCTGEAARALRGRAPETVEVVRAFRAGRVADVAAATELLRQVLRELGPRWGRPRLLVAVDAELTPRARERWRAIADRAGLRDLRLVPSAVPLVLGLGAGDATTLVVDVGAAATRVDVVHDGHRIGGAVVDLGGETFDGAVERLLRQDPGLAVGPEHLERLRVFANAASPEQLVEVAGRCVHTGLPRRGAVLAGRVQAAVLDTASALGTAVRRAVELVPDEAARAALGHGAILAGGAGRTRGLADALRGETGIPFLDADADPQTLARGLRLVPADIIQGV